MPDGVRATWRDRVMPVSLLIMVVTTVIGSVLPIWV